MAWKDETLSLHGGQKPDPTTGSRCVPIYQTTSYVYKDTEEAMNLFNLNAEAWASRINLEKSGIDSLEHISGRNGNIYTRVTNPTTDVLENRMMYLEDGVGALAVSSGLAAVSYALFNICQAGDHIVSSSSLYGGTFNLFKHTLPQFGIDCTFVQVTKAENFARNITDRTKCFFLETVGNPCLDIPEITEIAKIAHQAGIPLIVDNTVPSPYLCKPGQFGADIVVHSLTKFCGGHGNSIGGAIVDCGQFDWSKSDRFPLINQPDPSNNNFIWSEKFCKAAYILKLRNTLLRNTGACISPFNSFLILQGLETLPLRMTRHSENGMAVARFLQEHPKVNWVLYPGLPEHPTHEQACRYLGQGFGALVGFGIQGGLKAGKTFIEKLQLFSHLANIGDAKSLAIHPASTTHAQLSPEDREKIGVTSDFIRLSVGLEHIDDILEDIDQALR